MTGYFKEQSFWIVFGRLSFRVLSQGTNYHDWRFRDIPQALQQTIKYATICSSQILTSSAYMIFSSPHPTLNSFRS